MDGANVQRCCYTQGSFIYRNGDPLGQVHYLIEGEGEVLCVTDDRISKGQPGKGAWLGEVFDPNARPESYTEEAWSKRKHMASFKCTTARCRTMALDMRKVQAIMHSNPRLRENATRAEVSDLWGKLHRSLPGHRKLTYEAMVAVAACDGDLEEHEIEMLEKYRSSHKISEHRHIEALQKIGWTPEDWKKRRKVQK